MKREAMRFQDPLTGREVLQLTNSERRSVHGYYDLSPWSPATGRIVFSRMAAPGDRADILTMDRNGDDLAALAQSRSVTPNGGAMPQWSHDGRRVYFRDAEGGEPLLGCTDVETGETTRTPGSLRMICPTGPVNVFHSLFALPDEALLEDRDKRGVFLQDLETGESRLVASLDQCIRLNPRAGEIADWHLFVKHTKWSPDGRRILFVFTNEIRYDGKYAELPRVKDIYVVNADGTGLRYVSAFHAHPIWHPNSQDILTNSYRPGESWQSFVLIDAETGRWRLATDAMAAWGHPSYSPDATRLVVDYAPRPVGPATLDLIDVTTHTTQVLVSTKVCDHTHLGTHLHPVWSRDGRQILYASDASGTSQLCVVDV